MTNAKTDDGPLMTILGQVNCSDLGESTRWFEALFNRPPDTRPMNGLVEWHHGAGGLQLYRSTANAGHSALTLIVSDIATAISGLRAAGLAVGEIEAGDHASFLRLNDPDDNLIVLAQYYT